MDFLVLALAVWRISSLLVNESGPYTILDLFRHQVGVRYTDKGESYTTNELAELFSCIWCLSIWIGGLVTILYYFFPIWTYWLCLPFALSAIACVVSKWTP